MFTQIIIENIEEKGLKASKGESKKEAAKKTEGKVEEAAPKIEKKESKKPVILVSGDRHKGAIYKQDNLYELTTSSLNKPLPVWLATIWKETYPLILGTMHYNMNYGVIRIESSGVISVELKGKEGEILQKASLKI